MNCKTENRKLIWFAHFSFMDVNFADVWILRSDETLMRLVQMDTPLVTSRPILNDFCMNILLYMSLICDSK